MIGTALLDLLALVPRLPGPADQSGVFAVTGGGLAGGGSAGGGSAGGGSAGGGWDGGFLVSHGVGDVVVAPGGSAATMALAAARLDTTVGLIARLGGDAAGRVIMDRLRCGGVELLLPPSPSARTDRRLGHLATAGECRMSLHPSAGSLVSPADVADVSDRLRAADLVAASTAAPIAAVAAALRIGRRYGVLTVLRAAPAPLAAADLFPFVDVLTVGVSGARTYTGVLPRDRPSAYRAARVLLGRGPRLVAIGAGTAGVLVAWPAGHCWLPGPPLADPSLADPSLAGLSLGRGPPIQARWLRGPGRPTP